MPISDMFSVPAGSPAAENAQRAYRTYADQINLALNKGLAGQHMTASAINGNVMGVGDSCGPCHGPCPWPCPAS